MRREVSAQEIADSEGKFCLLGGIPNNSCYDKPHERISKPLLIRCPARISRGSYLPARQGAFDSDAS